MLVYWFFFFKQKTAYELLRSLVGSEMCIRDSSSSEQGRLAACHALGLATGTFPELFPYGIYTIPEISTVGMVESEALQSNIPVSYTHLTLPTIYSV